MARVRQNAARNGVAVDARVGNVFDELRGLERLRRAVRHDRARSAGVREEQGGGRQGACRLQGNQPARAEAAQPGRHARDLQLLVQRQRSAFAEIVYDAAVDAQAHVTVVEKRMQGRDHPVLLGVPETYYLKCFILRKLA